MLAPASHAAFASGQFVIPQILTRIIVESRQETGRVEQRRKRLSRVRREHQTFTDQECVESRAPQTKQIGVRAQSGFADRDVFVRDARNEFRRSLYANVERAEITVVYADNARTRRQRAVQLAFRVYFN